MNKAKILVVDDNEDVRFALALLLEKAGYSVMFAQDPMQCQLVLKRVTPDLILLDMNFSRDTTSGTEGLALLEQLKPHHIPTILMTAWANIELAVAGLQAGACDFFEKPWNKHKLLQQIKQHLQSVNQSNNSSAWVAESHVMQQLEQLIQQLAPTNANILLLGENGTGKSQLAERIHQLSGRKEHPLIDLNMAAIPDTLFESELFGHRKRAFTDAKHDRKGAFEQAQLGTLFLDEIGTLPLHLQPKLLQVLEKGSFLPLGAQHSLQANVRLIAATNQDLPAAIADQRFRQDLYYRLNTFVIELPPLRQRKEDILPLVQHFITTIGQQYKKPKLQLDSDANQQLLQYSWPGNVRELRHVIERAVIITSSDTITGQQLLFNHNQSQPQESQNEVPAMTLDALEKQRIVDVLASCQGNMNQAADILGISRHALYRRMDKYQLNDGKC